MIIFINHLPENPWYPYTPSRFGFSDSAETFVYLSGLASALAYRRSFAQSGIGLGTVRVLYRSVQIYLSHLASFFLLAALCVMGNRWIAGVDYIQRLDLYYFFDHTQNAMASLLGLSYVPHFIDILPMYLVFMLWIPAVWVLSKWHAAWALGFSALMYLGMRQYGWELPADPISGRSWYFNPFAWQLMFFTGFAIGSGWLRPPEARRWLVGLCLAFIAAAIPLAHEPTYCEIALFQDWRARLEPWLDKSHLGPLRWLHFLALAYVMSRLFLWKPHWLSWSLPRWIAQMGRHALPSFLLCTCLSYLGGMALDMAGRDPWTSAGVNVGGLGLLLLGAHLWAWLESKPWKRVYGTAAASTSMSGFDAGAFSRLGIGQALALSVPLAIAATPLLLLPASKLGDTVAPSLATPLKLAEAGEETSGMPPPPLSTASDSRE